jgi:hypothetical protein
MKTEMTPQQDEVATENGIPHPGDASDPSKTHNRSLHPATDSTSDNDASERPVREKLKKTSIASIPKSDTNHPRNDFAVEPDPSTAAENSEEGSFGGQKVVAAGIESRGRPVRKRSFDDLEADEAITGDRPILDQSGHSRKRSRDVRVGEDLKGDERLRSADPVTVREENEDEADRFEGNISGYREENTEGITKGLSQSSHQDVADQEMRDTAFSPRKKRSRDQLDTETHREQKIPATEEAKAHRRSEENDREGILQNGSAADLSEAQTVPDKQPKSVGGTAKQSNENASILIMNVLLFLLLMALKEQVTTGVENISSSSAPNAMRKANPFSASQSKPGNRDTTSQQAEKTATAFASSGFAALSSSSTSPFGALSAKSTTSVASPFLSVTTSDMEGPRSSDLTGKEPKAVANGAFGSAVTSTLSELGTVGSKSFGAAVTSNLHTFGGSTFGSGFGSAFVATSKLTSFAAPTGDAKWGSSTSEVRPFGAPAQDADDEEASGSEDDVQSNKAEENDEANGRFQQQGSRSTDMAWYQGRKITEHPIVETGEDGEETIFSTPRAALFRFDGTSWKEGGRGIFKLNVTAQSPDAATGAQRNGRFIMRAHQTYRVLLNEPVFKEMLVGDAKGNEPKSRSFAFAVIEKGKAVPHMIRASNYMV